MIIFDIAGAEEKIGYAFKDKMLLRKCFTHSSYAYEHKEDDNEILEFFGDAVIEFVITEYLVNNYAGDEGKLTVRRAEMVSNSTELKIIKKLGLVDYILLGEGQKKTAKCDEKLFSSLYEAIVAGIYIDGGLAPAKKFILDTLVKAFKGTENKSKTKGAEKDFKSQFQEYVQKSKMGSISYETLSKKGPEHLPEFRSAALLNGAKLAEGKGGSKKAAETEAAKKALLKLKREGGKTK